MVTWQLTVDCAEPGRLVAFWAEALGYAVEPPPGGAATWDDYWRSIGVPEDELDPHRDSADSLVDPDGRGPRIWFQRVPEPKRGKNRLHLDLKVGGGRDVPIGVRRTRVDAEVRRLAALGATVLRMGEVGEVDHYFVVLQDPEGNEFCVA